MCQVLEMAHFFFVLFFKTYFLMGNKPFMGYFGTRIYEWYGPWRYDHLGRVDPLVYFLGSSCPFLV